MCQATHSIIMPTQVKPQLASASDQCPMRCQASDLLCTASRPGEHILHGPGVIIYRAHCTPDVREHKQKLASGSHRFRHGPAAPGNNSVTKQGARTLRPKGDASDCLQPPPPSSAMPDCWCTCTKSSSGGQRPSHAHDGEAVATIPAPLRCISLCAHNHA